MSNKTRTPQPDPRPKSPKPRGPRAQKPEAPADSFYGSMLTDEVKEVLAEAGAVKGLDQEIAFLRFRLRGLLLHIVQNESRILKVIELIIRGYSAKIRASGNSPDADDTAVIDALRKAADNLGLDRVPWSECAND